MDQYVQIITNIRQELRQYISTHNLKALVIGMSGGIDSAVCAALAEPVCKELGIGLFGRSIPIETNKEDEIARAKIAGELFCTNFKEVDLTHMYKTIAPLLHEDHTGIAVDHPTKIRRGNIKARLRMLLLYDLAAKHGGLVLSTDNLTEYYLGFWTLHGDHADYGMIQNLWKTEVYELARCLVKDFLAAGDENRANALKITIDAIPTDGLGITKSDCEQFGVETYDIVDSTLKEWIDVKENPSENIERIAVLKNNPVVKRHEGSHFKRKWPITIPREILGIGGVK
jgi:NAD+ synthetase